MITKNDILKAYDDELDLLPHVRQLKDRTNINKLGGYQKIFDLHKKAIENVLFSIDPRLRDDYNFGVRYIRKPDFRVKTRLYNPTNASEIIKPISVESSLFITQLLEYCTFVEFNKPEVAQMVYKLALKTETIKPVEKFYDYLDKGLIKIAIRIRKIIVGPGQYILKEEFVPVSTTAYYEIYKKLMDEYTFQYGVVPDAAAKKLLSDKSISLACDMQDRNGKIIENPYTFNALNSYDSLLDKDGMPLSYYEPGKITKELLLSPDSKYVSDWNDYKNSIYNKYGVSWSDDVLANMMHFNVWNCVDTLYYDNRSEYSLQEQAKIYRLK